LLSLPLAFIRILPAVDYPDHLARIFLLSKGLELPGYGIFYKPHWTILPNLAFDLITVPLAHIMPVEVAGRVFVILLLGLTIYGGARLSRALNGRLTWLAALPALLVYNRILAYGFLNFLFGLGLLLLGLALHMELRSAAAWKRFAVEGLLALGLFTCHLVTLALYVVLATFYEIGLWRVVKQPMRQFAATLTPVFLPLLPLASLLMASPTAGEATRVVFRPFAEKLKLLHLTFQTGQGHWDLVFAVLVLAFIAALLVIKRIKIAPLMAWPLIGMLVLFLGSPTGFRDAMNVDTRMPVVLSALLLASFAPQIDRPGRLVGPCILALVGFRATTTALHYIEWDKRIQSVMNDMHHIPAGSILVVTRHEHSRAFDSVAWDPPLLHLGDLLLLEKPFLADDIFALPTQQPLLKQAPYSDMNLTEKVGGASAKNLEQFADQTIIQSAELGLTDRPTYIYYLRGPGHLEVPRSLEAVAIRPEYALLKVNPKYAQVLARRPVLPLRFVVGGL
jgi:hypothetical protein